MHVAATVDDFLSSDRFSYNLFPVAQGQVMASHHDTLVDFNISSNGRYQNKQRCGSG